MQEIEFLEFLNHLISADFMPHGYCYLWDPRIVWLNVISDGLITLSYYCIPVVLIYFIRKRRDLPFNWVFWMFGAFILACGTTHLMEVWNIWHASYLLAGIVKAVTAGVSVVTAVRLVPLVPKAVSVPNLIQLQEENRKLEQEIVERTRFDAPIEASLRRRANVGFVVVILLTSLLGFLSWRNQQQAAEEAEQVSHTHEVLATLEDTFRHVLEVESAARGFALTGNQSFLESYETGKYTIGQNLQALRLLVRDNPGQERRLGVLAGQVNTRIENSDNRLAAPHNTRTIPSAAPTERGKRDMDAARVTVEQMEAEEGRLLALRTQRTRITRRVTYLVTTLGSILGVVFIAVAWFSVSHQIRVSVRARAEVIAINADLERRVEQRTAALGESEGRLAGVIQSAMDSIISVDDQHRIVLFNSAAERMFRCAATELLGQPLLRLIPQRFHAAHGGHIRKFGETGVTNRDMGTMGALWAVRADGQEFQIEASISQVVTGGKKLFTVILRDVTERVQAEQTLRETQDRMTGIIASAMDSIITVDEQQHIVLFNAAAEQMFRCPAPQALGQPIERFIPQRFRAAHSGHIRKFEETGVTGHAMGALGALWAVRADGDEFQIEASISQIEAAGKKLFTVILRDITERKDAEEKLAAQAEELTRSQQALETQSRMMQSVLDSMAEGLIATDEQGQFIIWNPAAERILGLGSVNLSSQQWSQHYGLFLDDMVTPFPSEQLPLVRAIRGETSAAQMFVHNPELAEGVWIEASAGPLKDKEGIVRGGVVAFRDISQKRRSENEIQRLNAELERRVAERTVQLEAANQELESFTYTVAHDLRAPLRHIAGFSAILVEEFGPSLSAEAQRYLQRIQQGTQKMGRLVDELLSLAKVGRQPLNLEIAGLNSIVQEVIGMLQPDVEGRQVEWKIADLPFVECDPALIRQVFQNLLSNALKYSRPRSHAVIEIGQILQNEQPVVFVRDNGVGFSMKYADKLFGVFQRLHRSEDFEGTGVGLATVQRIVKKHFGRVWAEAELDKGATFYFTLGGVQPAEAKKETMALGVQP
jgi:PAS domain S-box-containing protein